MVVTIPFIFIFYRGYEYLFPVLFLLYPSGGQVCKTEINTRGYVTLKWYMWVSCSGFHTHVSWGAAL
jgi:hypothetical protein